MYIVFLALVLIFFATISLLGALDKKNQMTLDFKGIGHSIFLIGKSVDDINCSEYLYSYCKQKPYKKDNLL